ncbi:hypothetical protein ABD70_06360 [Alkalihalobacillus lehensis]|nr:hypothetical protein [Shouchella lehensis]
MYTQWLRFLPKKTPYFLLLLIILNFITFINANLLLDFFSLIYKLIPSSVINYIHKNHIGFSDLITFYAVLATITGVTTFWHFFYHWFFKHWRAEEFTVKNPRLYMDSIHGFFLEFTLIFSLVISLTLLLNPQYQVIVKNYLLPFSFNNFFMIFASFFLLLFLFLGVLAIINKSE